MKEWSFEVVLDGTIKTIATGLVSVYCPTAYRPLMIDIPNVLDELNKSVTLNW